MNNLANLCKDLKTRFHPKQRSSSKPVASWSEKDVLDGKIIDAFVIILRTRGCRWALKSGCSMCGYFNDSSWQQITEEQMLAQFQKAMDQYNQEPLIKIFTSGSFLDETELSLHTQQHIINTCSETAKKISIESRPEFITDQTLETMNTSLDNGQLEIGIGLETANDALREYAINKGFTFNDYQNAATLLKKNNFLLKTYVLVKPPFLSEKQALNDSIQTIETISDITGIVSINPTNVQRYTFVEYLWKRQQYRPPWLWSIIELLKESKKNHPLLRLQCDVAGGGKPRGAHNCKQCDQKMLNAIKEFSLQQNNDLFSDLDCSCQKKWQDQMELEDLHFGSLIDTQRWQIQ